MPPQNGSTAPIVMQGYMMKKKTSTNPTTALLRQYITLSWVTRYFVLYQDGKFIYCKEGPHLNASMRKIMDEDGEIDGEVICTNVAECNIERIKPGDVSEKVTVANSFYITPPKGKGGKHGRHGQPILLVTNGPEDFKRWIRTFRKLKSKMVGGVDQNVEDESQATPKEEMAPKKEERGDIPKEISASVPVQEVAAVADVEPKKEEAAPEPEKEEEAAPEPVKKEPVPEPVKEEEPAPEPQSQPEEKVEVEEEPKVEEAPVAEEPPKEEPIPEPPAESEATANDTSEEDDSEHKRKSVRFSLAAPPAEIKEVAAVEPKEEPEPEPPTEVEPEEPSPPEEEQKDVLEPTKPVDPNEGVLYPYECKGAKIHAFGDTLDELTSALDPNRALFGLFKTSLEETMDDATYGNTPPRKQHEKLVPFSLEFYGNNANPFEVVGYKDRSLHITTFCTSKSKVEDAQHIQCKESKKLKEMIAAQIEMMEDFEEEPEVGEKGEPSESKEIELSEEANKYANYRKISIASFGITAYGHAKEIEDVEPVPSGNEVLDIVRQKLGIPYNWVLFRPSLSELIVEDAGSGGVVELTKVLHGKFNDRVLFGLARVSFLGKTLGQRQIWFGLEWTGEDCNSVKMIRQLRECTEPMSKMIGDRSFTLTNFSTQDLTPEFVCERVKRSCDVTELDLTVDSMRKAHTEEQEEIKTYFEKLEEKELTMRELADARKKEEEKRHRIKARQERWEGLAEARLERKGRREGMNVPEILEDLGKDNMSGWVLLDVEI